jgi:cobalamin biosynthesis protein CobD/CbiB
VLFYYYSLNVTKVGGRAGRICYAMLCCAVLLCCLQLLSSYLQLECVSLFFFFFRQKLNVNTRNAAIYLHRGDGRGNRRLAQMLVSRGVSL